MAFSDIPAHKTPEASRCEMIELVHPNHTNMLDTLFGGQLVQWVDIAASIAAMRHAGNNVVTASIDALHFLSPIYVGEAVILVAQINEAFRTSMEVGVRVEVEDSRHPERGRRCATTAYLTFVAVDEHGKPCEVPALLAETDSAKKSQQQAQARRAQRQAERQQAQEGTLP